MKKTLVVLSLLISGLGFEQNKNKLSSKIMQAKSNTPLASTTVTVALNNDETLLQTDDAGNYSLMASSGTYQLSVYVEGFEYVSHKIDLTKDVVQNISLQPDDNSLDEIVITTSNKINIRKPEMSVNKLTAAEIKKAPVVLGETDILKTIL